jgi:hypothetical protein
VISFRPTGDESATIIGARPPVKDGATIVASGGATVAAGASSALRTSIRRSPPPAGALSAAVQLQIGSALGNRYEILELLGEGGIESDSAGDGLQR